ncbi:MAG: zinc-binding dehydrogenase [Pseudomonadota bacterium]
MQSGGQCIDLSAVGDPDVLVPVTRPVVDPGPGQILVRIKAAGVAYADVKMRHGIYPGAPKIPFVPGYDFAGVVEAVGSGETPFAVGDNVAGLTKVGSYAEYLTLAPRHVAKMGSNTAFVPAAASVLNYVTAYQLIHRCTAIDEKHSVLVHGGGGGVGTALLDLLRGLNVTVFATASESKHDLVRSYGATPIDYRAHDFVNVIKSQHGRVDAVFDHIGGQHLWRSRKVLQPRGQLVCFGFAGAVQDGNGAALGTLARITAMKCMPGPSAKFYGILSPGFSFEDHIAADLDQVMRLLDAGSISPHVGAELPLEEAANAHRMLEEARVAGKIVLLP